MTAAQRRQNVNNIVDVKSWRLPSPQEFHQYLEGMKSESNVRRKPSVLAVRQHLTPVDVYCYLKARFGQPNGFQNFLRDDSSDNWIHWDFLLKAGNVHDQQNRGWNRATAV